jgi:glycopeptide antibiotics resistance protein
MLRSLPDAQPLNAGTSGSTTYWPVGARAGYLAVIALATLSQLGIEPVGSEELQSRLSRAFSPAMTARNVVDGLRNLLLFAGWGLVWCVTAPTGRLRQAIVAATITGMLVSAGVETAQLFSPRRHASVLDVFTNTGGAFGGAVGAVALLRAMRAAHGARSFVGMPMFVFAAAYGGAALLEMFLPGMRQDLLPGATGGPFARLRLAGAQIRWGEAGVWAAALQALLMLPAGAFTVAALIERGRSRGRALLVTAGVGVLLAFILEFARGLTGQPIEIGMFVIHASGLVCGAWLAAAGLPALVRRFPGRALALMLAAAYTIMLLLWRWQPFVPHTGFEAIRQSFSANHLVPLQALTMKMDLFSASVVAVGFLLHLPLGALLAVWPLRLRGWLAHMLPGIWIVAVAEAGQLLIAARYFDVTDIIIGGAGVVAGWGLMRKAGFRPRGEALR